MAVTNAIILAHSTQAGTTTEILSFELDFPRFLLPEWNTHRQVSKNTSSSRAIPVATMNAALEANPFIPEYWGKNKSGMKADGQLDIEAQELAREIWVQAGLNAIESAKKLQGLQLHKQLSNRVSECFQFVKVCATATELNNLFHLRDHCDAQPEIADLAHKMRVAKAESSPVLLGIGSWHLPYYMDGYWIPIGSTYGESYDKHGNTLDHARKISVSCAAQTSYRKSDDSIEKAEMLFEVFFNTTHVHASPAEHQATPLVVPIFDPAVIDFDGLFKTAGMETATHIDKYRNVWSANFKHWGQYRQVIPGNVVAG